MRVYGGRPFALEDHFARLGRTCAGLRLEADLDALRADALALLEQAGEPESLLRLVVTRGGRRIAIAEPLPARPASARVATVTYAPTRVLNGLKTLSYAANMLAGRMATEQGFDEALFITPHGRVLEGPTWTFFWVRDGRLLTPPLVGRHPGLDHARPAAGGGARWPRRPARSTTCAAPRRRSSPRRCAR